MRKRLLSVLMIPLLLLGGCGEREAKTKKQFQRFRDDMVHVRRIAATARLTAEREDSVEEYLLSVESDGSEVVQEITEPDILRGVRARSKWGELSVEYDGVMLGAGPLDGEGLTPVSAVPAILNAMAGGYMELIWREEDMIAARLYAGEESRCTVWLDGETLVPLTAEMDSGGRRVLSCVFESWELEAGEPAS